MSDKQGFQLLAREFPRKDAVARVTGYTLVRAARSRGVARENGLAVLLACPVRCL